MTSPLRIASRMLPPPGPLRPLAAAQLISDAGGALLVTTLVLYFTRDVGLTGTQVGVGLTIGGVLGLLVGVPLGHLADVRGARELAVVLIAAEGLATAAYVFVGSFAAFVLCACAVVGVGRGASAVEQGLIARTIPDGDRVAGRAYLNAITNVGFGLGSAVATIGIAIDTRAGYQAMILVDALTFAAAAACIARVPHVAPAPARPGPRSGPRLTVLRDRGFMEVMALSGLLALQASILDVGFPLWTSTHTAAPRSVIGIVFVINCAIVAGFAVRVARGRESVDDAARSARRSGWFVAVACTALAVAGSLGATAAAIVLIGGMAIHAVGEMHASVSHWGLSFGLAPDDLQGEYQGASAASFSAAQTVGPILMAAIVALGSAGWLLFAVAVIAIGAAMVPVARRARPEPAR